MAIVVTKEPDIHVSEGDLNRFRQKYQKAFSMYCGEQPTLEEFIKREIAERKERHRVQ